MSSDDESTEKTIGNKNKEQRIRLEPLWETNWQRKRARRRKWSNARKSKGRTETFDRSTSSKKNSKMSVDLLSSPRVIRRGSSICQRHLFYRQLRPSIHLTTFDDSRRHVFLSLHPYLLHCSFRPRILPSLLPQACWLSFLNVMLDGRRELRVFIAAFIFFNNGWKNDKEESQKWDTKKNKG